MSSPTSCETILAEATRLEEVKRDFPAAIALMRAHLDSHPTCVEAYVHLAADSGILSKFDDAEQYARTGVTLDPDSGRARYYLGCALRSQGRPEDALTEMEGALVLIKREAARGTLAEIRVGTAAGWMESPHRRRRAGAADAPGPASA